MVHVQQRCLRAFEQYRTSFGRGDVEIVRRVRDEWPKTFRQHRHLPEDLIRIEALAAVRFDNAIRVFEIAFDARTKDVGHERVRSANAAATGFVFVRRSDAAQGCADFLVTEPFLARMVQSAMVWKDQMCARADLYALR